MCCSSIPSQTPVARDFGLLTRRQWHLTIAFFTKLGRPRIFVTLVRSLLGAIAGLSQPAGWVIFIHLLLFPTG